MADMLFWAGTLLTLFVFMAIVSRHSRGEARVDEERGEVTLDFARRFRWITGLVGGIAGVALIITGAAELDEDKLSPIAIVVVGAVFVLGTLALLIEMGSTVVYDNRELVRKTMFGVRTMSWHEVKGLRWSFWWSSFMVLGARDEKLRVSGYYRGIRRFLDDASRHVAQEDLDRAREAYKKSNPWG